MNRRAAATRRPSRSTVAVTCAWVALALSACTSDPKEQIRDRLAAEMKQAGHGASDAERQQVADALVQDVVELGEDAEALAAAQAAAGESDEQGDAARDAAIAQECSRLQDQAGALEAIQRNPQAGERRTEAELAALPLELEQTRSKLRELCGG